MDKALAPTISALINIIHTIGYFVCSPGFLSKFQVQENACLTFKVISDSQNNKESEFTLDKMLQNTWL